MIDHKEHFTDNEEKFFKELERASKIKVPLGAKEPIINAIKNILEEVGLGVDLDPNLSYEQLQAIWRELYKRKKHRIHKSLMGSIKRFQKKKKLSNKSQLLMALLALCIFLVKNERCMALCIPLISFPRPSLGMGR